jgi:hypothetical protein
MPNLGPGNDQHVNLTYTPTWLFTPNTSATANLRLYNEGRNPVYIGQAGMGINGGFPVMPGARPVELTNCITSMYAMSAVSQGAVLGTVGAAVAPGVTVITSATTAITGSLSTGGTIMIANTVNTANAEVVAIASFTTTSTSLTLSTTTQFPHATSDVFYACTPTYGQLRVTAGMV